MKLDGGGASDVRAEIAEPFLAALGYKRGTANDIARERTRKYQRHFLGRKKSTDQPRRGYADYILSVHGAGRWVLETKAPNEPIDIDAIDQAISYARHPEVAASYSAVLNGLLAPPLLLLIMRLANDKKVMGKEVNGWLTNLLGGLTTLLLFGAVFAMAWSWLD